MDRYLPYVPVPVLVPVLVPVTHRTVICDQRYREKGTFIPRMKFKRDYFDASRLQARIMSQHRAYIYEPEQ